MKKLLALVLVFALLLGITACGKKNETHEYILYLLEMEEYDMAIHVIEGLRDNNPNSAEQQGPADIPQNNPPAAFDQVIEMVPECNGSNWIFHMDLINETSSTLTLEVLLIRDWLDDQELGTMAFEGENLASLPIGELVLESNNGRGWDDGHPVTSDFNRREYLHVFRDEQGEPYRISFLFDMRGLMSEGEMPAPQQPSGDWVFPIVLENTTDAPLTLKAMDITNLMNGQQLGTSIFEGEDNLAMIGLGGLVLQPGETFIWQDGHPATSEWNGREYRFHFVDGDGPWQTQTFRFENLDKPAPAMDYSQDNSQDLKTLRHGADFSLEVFPDVFWVPANHLGGSRYTNAEIYSMLASDPEYKREQIRTLYEALQLYQIGNFTPSDDNIRVFENGINWEHHKPGVHAVRTNTGCCATDSNWLHYLLDGDYEQVGFLATSQRNGGGHVYNYIFQDGWYYFVDLTHYYAGGSPMDTAAEDGDERSYRGTDFILGNIHKTRSVQSYVDYVQQTFNDPPGLMFLYTADNVLAVDGVQSQSGTQIVYEEANGQHIDVVFDDPNDNLTYGRAPSPANIPDWWNICPSYEFPE